MQSLRKKRIATKNNFNPFFMQLLKNNAITILLLLSVIATNAQSFTPHPDNPILPLSFVNPGTWNDPCVIKQGDTYWMYASSKNGVDIFDGEVVPYLLTSSDGISWTLYDSTSLLSTSTDTAAWDYSAIETPSVVFFEGEYHLYYTAIAKSGIFAIGHATSFDGINWNKEDIILTPTNIFDDWMSYLVGEPGAVVYHDKLYLYFTGVGNRFDAPAPAGKSVIGLIISDDGFNFGTPQQVLEQGLMYPPAENFYGYSTPFPIVLNDTLHLFFDVAQEDPEWLQVAIHHAYSADGINDFIQDDVAIFHKDDFDWTQREIRAPAVLADEGQLKMWFCGDDIFATAKWGIGYAWSNDFAVNNTEFITEPITIFPNPANDYLTIKSNEQWDNFTLTDLTGKIILAIFSGTENNIDVSFVSPGIYFAQLKSKQMILETRKIIITH